MNLSRRFANGELKLVFAMKAKEKAPVTDITEASIHTPHPRQGMSYARSGYPAPHQN